MWELAVAGFILWPILGCWTLLLLAPAQPTNLMSQPVTVYNMMIMHYPPLVMMTKDARTRHNGHRCTSYQFNTQRDMTAANKYNGAVRRHDEMIVDWRWGSDKHKESSLSTIKKGIAYPLFLEGCTGFICLGLQSHKAHKCPVVPTKDTLTIIVMITQWAVAVVDWWSYTMQWSDIRNPQNSS